MINGKNKNLIVLLTFIIWIALLAVIFTPKIKNAIYESGALELLAEIETEEVEESRKVMITLVNEEGTKDFYIYTPYYGGGVYHDTIEALLDFELEVDGNYVSLIDKRTKLIGLTVSDGIAYVEFTKAFLKSKKLGPYSAMDQVKSTLFLFEEIEKIVILIDGVPLDSQ